MWRLGLFAVTACWAPGAGPTLQATPARCEIHDANIDTVDGATLLVGGISFARFAYGLTRFDVDISGTQARVHLETDELELESELRLAGLALRKRTKVHDGWLTIRSATFRTERDGVVEATVQLPDGVRPTVFTAALPCSDITFATAWGGADEGPAVLEILELAPSTSTPLAIRPGGPALVFLEPAQPLLANVLERRGPFARVEISDLNAITGWVSTEHTRKHLPADEEGGYGFGRSGESIRSVRCPHDVSIYVDTSVKVHRVGRFKPNATIEYEGPSIGDPGVTAEPLAVPVDLGGGELKPYVERTDLASCMPPPPR